MCDTEPTRRVLCQAPAPPTVFAKKTVGAIETKDAIGLDEAEGFSRIHEQVMAVSNEEIRARLVQIYGSEPALEKALGELEQ